MPPGRVPLYRLFLLTGALSQKVQTALATVKLNVGENKASYLLMFPGGLAPSSPDNIRVISLSKKKFPQPGKMTFHSNAET